jgi:hypothetical protein
VRATENNPFFLNVVSHRRSQTHAVNQTVSIRVGLLRFQTVKIRLIFIGLKPKKPHLNTHSLIDCMSLRTSTRYHVLKNRRHVDENSTVSQGKHVTHVGLDPLHIRHMCNYEMVEIQSYFHCGKHCGYDSCFMSIFVSFTLWCNSDKIIYTHTKIQRRPYIYILSSNRSNTFISTTSLQTIKKIDL